MSWNHLLYLFLVFNAILGNHFFPKYRLPQWVQFLVVETMLGMIQKDRSEDDLLSDLASNSPQKQISGSLFSIPGLFVGFTGKGSSECDSVRSPTSPLDSRLFSGLGSSFWSMRSEYDAHQNKKKSFCSKGVGLGIVDSLSDERRNSQGEIAVEKSEKNILFGSQLKIAIPQFNGGPNQFLEITGPCITSPKSLPNYASSLQRGTRTGLSHLGCSHFAEKPNAASSQNARPDKSSFGSSESMVGDAEILSRLEHTGRFCSDSGVKMSTSDSGSRSVMAKVEGFNTGSNFSSATMLARDIELSEDYTRVITHGPNPKTKHIYGDLVLEEEEEDVFEISIDKSDETRREPSIISLPMDGFLTVCCACKKKLVEGEDIYMYRGEKAFCSSECRLQEIIIDEEMEKASMTSPVQSPSSSWVEIFRPGLAVAT